MTNNMSPTTKKLLDYAAILLVLYLGAIGLKTIIYMIVNDEAHPLVGLVDVLRFNTEIGLVLFYIRNIPVRNAANVLQYKKALTLMFFWPFVILNLKK